MSPKKREFFSECRKNTGTQKKVAIDLGISTVYLRMIENGTFTPGRDLMFKMSSYFSQPVDKIFPDLFEKDVIKCARIDN
jgi:putative transcriptional regulator